MGSSTGMRVVGRAPVSAWLRTIAYMLDGPRDKLRALDLHIGRWTVIVGAAVGGASFAYLVADQHSNLYSALMRGLVGAGLTMGVLGIGERFWRKKKIAGAQAQAGPQGISAGVTFGDQVADVVSQVNQRVDEHVKTINERLYDLEKRVFKADDAASEAEE